MNEKPWAVDAQFWVLLAGGHPLSHWASHQWVHCRLLIKGLALVAELQQTHIGETSIIWPLSMTGGLCKSHFFWGGVESWLMDRAFGVDG